MEARRIVKLCDTLRANKGADRVRIFRELGWAPNWAKKFVHHITCATSPKRNAERLLILRLLDEGHGWMAICKTTGLTRPRVQQVEWAREAERAAREELELRAVIAARIAAGEPTRDLVLEYGKRLVTSRLY